MGLRTAWAAWGLGALLALGCTSHSKNPSSTTDNSTPGNPPGSNANSPGVVTLPPTPVTFENQHDGSSDWHIPPNSGTHDVEGYALQTVVRPGDSVPIAVSV